MLTLNLEDSFIVEKMKSAVFFDIETSLIDVRTFRLGKQHLTIDNMRSHTKLLSAAWGSMYDLYTKQEKGVQGIANHFDAKAFAKNPLDDTLVLRAAWEVLDKASVIIAHNAQFDWGWLMGRFVQLGWPLPSKFSTICTYRALHRFNFNSKKLEALSFQLAGTHKLPTQLNLWQRCSDGDKSAFEEMLTYNKGDIFSTLFKVYMLTSIYYPDLAVDMVDYELGIPQCKVSGEPLDTLDYTWMNRSNGCEYMLYNNQELGIIYRDRYNVNSSKAGLGLIRHHI
jgi:hypothetical protein